MLILTRKAGEVIVIGDSVRVKVLGVRGGQVKIGIDAPSEVPVHRHEIYERIKGERGACEDGGCCRDGGSRRDPGS